MSRIQGCLFSLKPLIVVYFYMIPIMFFRLLPPSLCCSLCRRVAATATRAIMTSAPLPSPSGASEHALQSLAELTAQSGKIGQWMLRVCGTPDEHEYKYTYQGKPTTGKVLVCHFVSTVSSQYCLGKFKRKGKEPAASSEFLKALKNQRPDHLEGQQSFVHERQATLHGVADQGRHRHEWRAHR